MGLILKGLGSLRPYYFASSTLALSISLTLGLFLLKSQTLSHPGLLSTSILTLKYSLSHELFDLISPYKSGGDYLLWVGTSLKHSHHTPRTISFGNKKPDNVDRDYIVLLSNLIDGDTLVMR